MVLSINILEDGKIDSSRRYVDNAMKEGTANGLQKPVRQAQVISESMEMELFQKKILSDVKPENMLRTVYFLLGKFSSLRSRETHRNFVSSRRFRKFLLSPL